MKKITLLFLLLTLSFSIHAQFTEGFESGIPDDWTVINNGGSNGWVQNTAPNGGALEGDAVASITYNSSAHDDYLITPAIPVSVGVNESLSFNVKSRSSSFLESFEVLLSTTDTSEASFSVVLQAESDAPAAWTKTIFDLSAYDGQTVYVAVRATDTDRFELYLDDVYSGIEIAVPGCATTPSPAIAATDVQINTATASVNIAWEAPASGAPTGYEVFWGETSGDLTSLGTTDETSVSITNVNYNTTYYWMVVPSNAGGSAEGCAEWSFTTDPMANIDYLNPFTVYPGAGWSEATGPINEPSGTTGNFTQDDFGNDDAHENGKSAKINIYGTGVDEYLVTPKYDLSGGTYYLNADLALTVFATSNASALDPDDYLALLVTQDDGATWTEIARWDENSTLTPEGAPMDEIMLTGYNSETYFAFYAFSDTSGVDNDLFIDNFQITAASLAPAPTAPTADAPIPPTRQSGDVISVFSDAYTDINVTNFNPGWGQSGAVDAAYDPTGEGTNTVLEYSNFNYQGTEFEAVNASAMEFVHIDIWTADATDVKFSPINNGTGAAEFLVNVPLVSGAWSSVDIAIADFTGMTWDSLFQMKFDGQGGVNPSTIYIDNVYFWKNPTTAPTTDAPTPPAREAGDVISIYSDAYTNINVTNFNPGWGQSGAVDAAYDPTGAGTNTVLEYSNFNYQGTEFDAADASSMEFVHIDIWTADATDVKFSPINNGTGAAEFLVNVPLVSGAWSSVDIAIADFTGMTWDSLFQMKFDGQGGQNPSTIYIDNVYFYKEPSTTSDIIFITELADPNDNAAARYVEIYNGGTSAVDLTGWTLRRYTNGNAEPQTTGEDLSPIGSLAPGAIAIIAANGTAFEAAFGMAADISAGSGGPADSNGDDQIYITDASDTIVDFFGVPGEDGSGTDHEFEDGRAERKASVTQGTATWDVNEWNIDNDAGAGDGALNVDGGFDPGVWIGADTAGVENESFVTLNMYPNPANDVLNISSQSTINTVEIFNVLGQKVITMQVEDKSAEINVSNLNAGIYLIKYEINNSTSTKKFVKN